MATAPIQLPSIYQSIKAPTGANPQDLQSVQDQMAMTYAPQENSINDVLRTLQQHLDSDTAAQQQYGQIADQKISDIGAQLKDQLQGNVGAIGDIYKQGQANIGSAYDEQQKTLGDVGQSIQDRLAKSAAALGQTQALKADPYGADPVSRLQANLATMKGTAATGKASATSNMATLGTQLSAIAQKAVGDSERDYAQKRTNVATQVLKTIGQLQTTTNGNIMTQLQKFSDLAQTEGPAFRQMLQQATTARNAAERQAALDALDAQLKNSQIDKNEAEALKASNADDPNSLDNIIKNQTIAKNQALLDRSTYADSGAGYQNMMDWLNDLRVNKKALTGTQYAGIQNFINQNANNALALNEDPYTYLVNLAQSKSGQGSLVATPKSQGSKYKDSDYNVPLQVLLDALGKRYTGIASSGAKIGTTIK